MIFNSTEREGVLVMLIIDHRPYCYSAVCPVGETCILFVAGSNQYRKGFSSSGITSGNFSSLGIEYGGQQCVGQNPGNRSLLCK